MVYRPPLSNSGIAGGSAQISAEDFARFGQSIPTYGIASQTSNPLRDLLTLSNSSQQTGGLNNILKNVGSGVDVASGLAQIMLGFQANKLARENFDFQKSAYKNNLEGTTRSYNTALEDRANSRYHTQGNPDGAARYIDEHRLNPKGLG